MCKEKTKICTKCGIEKLLSEFYPRKKNKPILEARCKECRNKDKIEYYKKHPNKRQEIKHRHRYGIEPEYYKKLLNQQKEKCKICKQKIKLVIDHNHKTNKIRGLLCHKCNTGIGLLNDDIILLKNALKYLKDNDE